MYSAGAAESIGDPLKLQGVKLGEYYPAKAGNAGIALERGRLEGFVRQETLSSVSNQKNLYGSNASPRRTYIYTHAA